MGKYKKDPKYNVLSIRVTDEEKAIMDDLKQNTRKSISTLLREAIHLYSPQLKVNYNRGSQPVYIYWTSTYCHVYSFHGRGRRSPGFFYPLPQGYGAIESQQSDFWR